MQPNKQPEKRFQILWKERKSQIFPFWLRVKIQAHIFNSISVKRIKIGWLLLATGLFLFVSLAGNAMPPMPKWLGEITHVAYTDLGHARWRRFTLVPGGAELKAEPAAQGKVATVPPLQIRAMGVAEK